MPIAYPANTIKGIHVVATLRFGYDHGNFCVVYTRRCMAENTWSPRDLFCVNFRDNQENSGEISRDSLHDLRKKNHKNFN